jgi:hypothetical protein
MFPHPDMRHAFEHAVRADRERALRHAHLLEDDPGDRRRRFRVAAPFQRAIRVLSTRRRRVSPAAEPARRVAR